MTRLYFVTYARARRDRKTGKPRYSTLYYRDSFDGKPRFVGRQFATRFEREDADAVMAQLAQVHNRRGTWAVLDESLRPPRLKNVAPPPEPPEQLDALKG